MKPTHAIVRLQPGEHVDRALKRLRRQCEESGLTRELKRRQVYTSPGEARRVKHREAVRKQRRRVAIQAERERLAEARHYAR